MHLDQYVSDGSEYAGLHLEYTESVECYDRPGLVVLAQDDPAYYAPTLDALWNAFGEERLVYAGNWPVSWRYGEYAQVQKLATTYFEQKGVEVLEKVMWKNSQTAYGWGGGRKKMVKVVFLPIFPPAVLSPLIHRYIRPFIFADIDLPGAGDFLVGVLEHLRPLRQPAGRTWDGEQDRKHIGRKAHRLVDNPGIEIGHIDQVPAYIKKVKNGDFRLMGFGHRVYKNYDPRARILKEMTP